MRRYDMQSFERNDDRDAASDFSCLKKSDLAAHLMGCDSEVLGRSGWVTTPAGYGHVSDEDMASCSSCWSDGEEGG